MIIPLSEAAKPGFSEKIISFITEKSFFLSKDRYSINIGNQELLHLYSIVIDEDQRNISIGN